MMQTTDFGDLHDLTQLRRLDGPHIWRILLEREVSSRPVIVREVAGQDAAQVPVVEHEDMTQTLAPDRADEPLGKGILLRAVGRCRHFPDPHALQPLPERMAVDHVAITEEIGRRGLVWEGVHDLLGRPGGDGMLGDVEVQDAPAVVGEHDEDKEDAPTSGGNREEVDRDEVAHMVVRNVRQVCKGGMQRLGMSRETVRSATSMFRSSPTATSASASSIGARGSGRKARPGT